MKKSVRKKFNEFLDFSVLKKNYEEIEINNDVIFKDEIKDLRNQELDVGLSNYMDRVSQGAASKASVIWGQVFRMYSALSRVKKSNQNVLELGCSSAFLRKMIHSGTYVSGTNYVGVDIKLSDLFKASKLMPKCNNPSIFINSDIHNLLPFVKDKSVNVIFAMEVFEHVEEENGKKLLMDMKRVLSDNGLLFLSMPNSKNVSLVLDKKYKDIGKFPFHHREYSIQEFKKLCKNSGFEIIDYWGWSTSPRELKRVLKRDQSNDERFHIYERLTYIMGSAISSQIIGQLYPESASSIVYEIKRQKEK